MWGIHAAIICGDKLAIWGRKHCRAEAMREGLEKLRNGKRASKIIVGAVAGRITQLVLISRNGID